jgi:hypothetical protein
MSTDLNREVMLGFFNQVIIDKIIPLITEQIMAVHKHLEQPADVPLVKVLIPGLR